ncbi:MAG: hypothetical protein HC806_06215 [Anaerolineae bacterium]|nr:hypothetical protein [Anaerolineae bacterium]
MVALNYVRQGVWHYAIITGFIGSLTGAVLIRQTEGNIVPGKKEKLTVTITNGVVFFLAMMLATFYFAQSWGNWQGDVILGLVFGFGVGIAQDLAAGKRTIGFRHIAALTISFIPALILLRVLSQNYTPWQSALMLNVLISMIIVSIDYSKAPTWNKGEFRKSP